VNSRRLWPLTGAKRKGLAEYGFLASRYVDGFEHRWVGREPAGSDEFLGSADIQSLADLGNAYGVVREMRAVPFDFQDILRLAVATAAPLVPLGLTVFSLEELLSRLVNILL
jgi:hypothetical protein